MPAPAGVRPHFSSPGVVAWRGEQILQLGATQSARILRQKDEPIELSVDPERGILVRNGSSCWFLRIGYGTTSDSPEPWKRLRIGEHAIWHKSREIVGHNSEGLYAFERSCWNFNAVDFVSSWLRFEQLPPSNGSTLVHMVT